MQFEAQKKLFLAKFSSRWLSAMDTCRRNPRALWKTVNNMLQPPSHSATNKLSADDFAKVFVDKVAKIHRCSSRASHHPKGDLLPLTELEPTSVHEIIKLLSTLPAKSCSPQPFLFFLRTDYMDSPRLLLLLLSIYVFTF